jgi:adenylyltransferase/sulfurtransferase
VGVLGLVPGQVGLVQATEVVKLIVGIGTPMVGRFFIYNALTLTMRFVETAKNIHCPLCGETPLITELTGNGGRKDREGGSCSL